MLHAHKEAVTLCKILLRNGYDAHVINAPLQRRLAQPDANHIFIDIACEPDAETLCKLLPEATTPEGQERYMASLVKDGITFLFYKLIVDGATHPDNALIRITPRMVRDMNMEQRITMRLTRFSTPEAVDVYEGFDEISKGGAVRLIGLPDETLRNNYLLAIRALRFAANFDLPVAPNTWVAIVRASSSVLNYVSMHDIMDEWRKVSAESMWKFVKLLHDAHILQGLIPEISALSCIKQIKNDSGEEETVFEHTIECMKRYPEEEFHYDWLGTLAMLFHDVGKLHTGEYFNNMWTFYQHHRVAAKVTREILRRLHFLPEDIDLICHLVLYHMRFHFMLTDRGIRRFKALDEYPRLIEMCRADIKARNGSYTYFNHNMKYLTRAETPEQMLEPLLNGNEIMTHTTLKPGPIIGEIRDALLQAQIAGEVESMTDAEEFVKSYAQKHVG